MGINGCKWIFIALGDNRVIMGINGNRLGDANKVGEVGSGAGSGWADFVCQLTANPGPGTDAQCRQAQLDNCCVGVFCNPGRLGRSPLLDGLQPRAVLFLHLLGRNHSAAKVCELQKLVLDCL